MFQRRLVATLLMSLMLSGCGATSLAPSAARLSGGFKAASETTEAANPFTKLKITVEAQKAEKKGDKKDEKKAGLTLKATNDAKLKVTVEIADGALVSASVNRTAMVKDGELVLGTEDADLEEAAAEAGDDGKREERRRKSYVKVLTNLATGLKAAKVKKDQEKDVKAVVDALKAFLKDQRESAAS